MSEKNIDIYRRKSSIVVVTHNEKSAYFERFSLVSATLQSGAVSHDDEQMLKLSNYQKIGDSMTDLSVKQLRYLYDLIDSDVLRGAIMQRSEPQQSFRQNVKDIIEQKLRQQGVKIHEPKRVR